MVDLQKMIHGELNWDAKFNKIIEYLESGQAIAGMKISEWSTAGIVLASNFKWEPNSKGYRYIQYPNGKDIELDLKFSPVDVSGLTANNIITLPDELRADGMGIEAGFWNGQANVYRVVVSDKNVLVYRIDNDAHDKWNGSFLLHAHYFHQD